MTTNNNDHTQSSSSSNNTSDNNSSSPKEKTRFEREIDSLTKQTIELDTVENKLKQLFPQEYAMNNSKKFESDQLLRHVDPTVKYFTIIGGSIGAISSAYLFYQPLDKFGRFLFSKYNYRMRYYFTIPIFTFVAVTASGVLSGLYPYATHRALKFLNNQFTNIDVNDNFDDFLISGLPFTKNDLVNHLNKFKK